MGRSTGLVKKRDDLHILRDKATSIASLAVGSTDTTAFLWNLRLGHASFGRVRLVAGNDNSPTQNFLQCTICPLSKQTRFLFL